MKTMAEVRAFLYPAGFGWDKDRNMSPRDVNRLVALQAMFPGHASLTHLPDSEVELWEHNGIEFKLLPRNVRGSVSHRFQFHCPECGKWLSVGRVHQHHHKETK